MHKTKSYSLRIVTVVLAAVPILLIGALGLLPGEAQAAPCRSSHSPDLAKILSFDMPLVDKLPDSWMGVPAETVSLVPKIVHQGQKVVLLSRDKNSPDKSSFFANCTQMDFTGKAVTLQGYLRTEDVSGYAGLGLEEDGDSGKTLVTSDKKGQNLHGTTGWKKYSITLPIKTRAVQLQFAVLLHGSGKVWVSGLQLLVDGKPIWGSPKPDVPFYTDHQFDHGSGIAIEKLDKTQISNLVTLGKVWGLLKYYDPTVTSGKRQWDYDLFRILPTLLKAKDRESANAALVRWIKKLGPVAPCKPCVRLETKNLQLRPQLGWIKNQKRLGEKLSEQLQHIYANRRSGHQFYVSFPGGLNPDFDHQRRYKSVKFPDSGFQLLALYRYWNSIEYWYPYRNIMGENWGKVLAEFIPKLALAKSRKDYELQLMALIAQIHDTHAHLWSAWKAQPPAGPCYIPIRLRFVQNQPIVTKLLNTTQASGSPFRVGDVIKRLDGEPVAESVKKWMPYYGASNKAALQREIATLMTRGSCGSTTVVINRDGSVRHINAERVPWIEKDFYWGMRSLPGPTFQLLSPEVAYINLSSVKANEVAGDIKRAAGTKGLIIDDRDDASDGSWALMGHVITKATPFVRYAVGDLSNPGAFHWKPPLLLTPKTPYYAGKVVILVDSHTQSHSEYRAMALKTAPDAIVVGSTTAGADGNLSWFLLPGGLKTAISGIGVFYPDKKPTQRVGIVPDVVVKPTIADIRAGRDPVLDKAIRLIVGPKVPEAKIRKMYQVPPNQPSNTH